MIWPTTARAQTLGELYAFNLSEEQLRERFLDPYERAQPITWSGRSLEGGDVTHLRVGKTAERIDERSVRASYSEYDAFIATDDVTNDWVFTEPGAKASQAAESVPKDLAVDLCRRFDVIRRQLARRHEKRQTLEVKDEYDVQNLMHALLFVYFDDVRAESWNPNYLGGASRVDFLVPEGGFVLEIKKTRPTLLDREVGKQLAEDVTRYSDPAANRGASTLICFIHDPDRLLANPVGLERDLAAASTDRLKVVGVVG